MKIKLSILLFFFTSLSFGQSFKKGEGSEFTLKFKDGLTSNLSIYVTHSELAKIGIEYYFNSNNGIIPIKLWQQFHFSYSGEGPVSIDAGFVYAQEMTKPEALTRKYLNVNDGVQVNDFLFSKRSEIDASKIGEEKVKVPAGTVMATHYRKVRGGQTVDFWISDKTKPIGLVKLNSKSDSKAEHNYGLELMSLIKDVKAKIDPKK